MLETSLLEWLNLVLRWLHVMVGITWIGTSFFFVWLNQSIKNGESSSQNSTQPCIWAVHGGGLYQFTLYNAMPSKFPKTLRWFKWEAYTTWLSGICLLLLMYYVQADVYLIDKNNADLTIMQATGVGLTTIIVSWLIYDILCHRLLVSSPAVFIIAMLVIIVMLSYGLTHVFSGRGAYMHTGALIGTIMAGNVFRVIIPAQKEMLVKIKQGGVWDIKLMAHARLRSTHNNYLTLPVLFFMLSNHYPELYNHNYNWLIIIGMILVGAIARHYFMLKHRGDKQPGVLLIALAGFLLLAMSVSLTKRVPALVSVAAKNEQDIVVTASKVVAIIEQRCNSCHSSYPSVIGFRRAPKGINFDTPVQIQQYAQHIKRVAVDSNFMPPANLTDITRIERETLGIWIAQGAVIE